MIKTIIYYNRDWYITKRIYYLKKINIFQCIHYTAINQITILKDRSKFFSSKNLLYKGRADYTSS